MHLVVGGLLAIVAAPALRAHHSFAAEFDVNKPVTLTGGVTRLEWANPHIWVYLDVKDEQGTAALAVRGRRAQHADAQRLVEDSLKMDDQVTMIGWLARDGSKTCNIRVLTMPDGRSVLAGSAGGETPALPKK